MNIMRWIAVLLVSAGAFFGTLLLNLALTFFVPFPTDLADPTAGFLMGISTVLLGSLIAPRRQGVTSGVLLIASSVLATVMNFHFISTLSGGAIAVALVTWWFHPRRKNSQIVWVAVSGVLAAFGFIGLIYSRFVERPARSVPLDASLQQILGTNATNVTLFNQYDLGGFIDSEYLWRIEAPSEVVGLIVNGLKLQATNGAPTRFWNMPPHYWPKSMPAGANVFQSPDFPWSGRGPDGNYYFLLHDKEQGKAFVWFKANF